MKIGFSKEGLTLNSKKFNPLNFSVNGYGIEAEEIDNKVDAFELLSKLASVRMADTEATTMDKIKILQSMVEK
ncbi:MAG: hypothetical protein JG777_1112 [Clostridia bacterium]|uniref:hypothetical protein n=1 Tax=Petroclostridium xylanilyticum TaxID=1792311 RepID=UPI000B985BB6|nr:hypothetical protein [Petroclostridium xylanilyticum]MBZ4645623.1 hypothetical protein [Clostridia bacterium]